MLSFFVFAFAFEDLAWYQYLIVPFIYMICTTGWLSNEYLRDDAHERRLIEAARKTDKLAEALGYYYRGSSYRKIEE